MEGGKMWLTDLLQAQPATRPTRPTSKNNVGRHESLVAVAPSDTSDTSDMKNCKESSPEENGGEQTTFAQVSYKNPGSVRHLPLEDEFTPVTAALAHAQRMLVRCPIQKRDLHCWHCSSCGEAQKCRAWHTRRHDVEFFKGSEKPYSLSLVEGSEMEASGQAPDYAAFCPEYWKGCFSCPGYVVNALRFCARYNRVHEAPGVVQ
jgi:hypothetical protein